MKGGLSELEADTPALGRNTFEHGVDAWRQFNRHPSFSALTESRSADVQVFRDPWNFWVSDSAPLRVL
jgi:hypothetical protein